MIVKKLQDVPFAATHGSGGVKKQIVIGPDDGSEEIALRYFQLAAGDSTPHHTHDWPHLVRIMAGAGFAGDGEGNRTPIQAGDFVYVPDNEFHYFENVDSSSLEFICVVPRRGES